MEVHIPLAWASLADKMGQGKIPRCSHRLTDAPEESDLWTAWQLFPLDDDQTCHSKDWVGDGTILYNSVKTGSQLVWRPEKLEKASSQQKAGPPSLRLRNLGERERPNADGHKSGGQYVAVMFGLRLPLSKTLSNLSNLSNKVRGIFF